MNYNYHTHTYRCNHATGIPEEYIRKAIENGIKYMGFSDHFPFVCRDGFEARYRVPVSQVEEYISELETLREKYKDRLDLKIGFEMEYYHGLFEDMLKKAIEYGGEYLILGQHFLGEEHPDGVYAMKANDNEEHLKQYVTCVVDAIKSGVFTYIAHPDVFYFTGDEATYCSEMRKICVASTEHNVPLEINFLGIRGKRNYPSEMFWKIAGEERSPVTFGFDAHDTQSAFDGDSIIEAQKLVEKYKLNYIGIPKIISIPKHE